MTHNGLGKLIRDTADQIVHEGPRFDTDGHALRSVDAALPDQAQG